MKFVLLVSVLLVAALADDPHGLKAAEEKCQGVPETHVDPSVFEDLRKHHEKATLPANFGKHILCLAKGLNLVNDDGKVNAEGVKTHVGHVEQEAANIDNIVKECAVDQANAEETARALWKCLHKNHVLGGHHGRHGGSHEDSSEESGEHHHHHDHNHAHH